MLLAIAAGALRRFAALREQRRQPSASWCPSASGPRRIRTADGNRITFAFVELPVNEPEPLRRVALIRGATAELKESGRIAGSEVLLRGWTHCPGS